MPQFTDIHGRRWTVTLTIGDAEALKQQLEIDVFDLQQGGVFDRLLDNPSTLVSVLYLILGDQIESAGLSTEEFARSLGGDTLSAATDAFLEALVELYPKVRRPALRKVLAKVRALEAKGIDKATTLLDDPATDRALDAELDKMFGKPSGSSRASPGSTPGR